MISGKDSMGKIIKVGDTVRFRGQFYTIEAFKPGQGRNSTAALEFNKKPHIDELPDEISVDLIEKTNSREVGLADQIYELREDIEEEEFVDLPPAEFLRDLSEKLRHVPCIYDFDQYHADHLIHLARMLEGKEEMHSSVIVADLLTKKEIAKVVEHDIVVSITEPIVHILLGAYTYCGITKAPGHWSSWARIEDHEHANCRECLNKLLDEAILCAACSAVLIDGNGRIVRFARANTKEGPHCGDECRRKLCKHCVYERCEPGRVFCSDGCFQEYEMENNCNNDFGKDTQ